MATAAATAAAATATSAPIKRSSSGSPAMSLHSTVNPSLFPLRSIADVVNFFRRSLESSNNAAASHGSNSSSSGGGGGGGSGSGEPDLTLLSIVAGYIELSLTTGDAAQAAAAAASAVESVTTTTVISSISGNGLTTVGHSDIIVGNSVPFPVVTHELVSGLYKKFQSILSVVEKPKASGPRQATREIIKKVSDVIWHSLIRSSYKDRAHLQNLYSYLSGNKLDCFGVALAVVAGCQLLGYRDVHLAIAEDHAWVVFGNKRVETIEVTWHGKGSEDKRGQDIAHGIEAGSWLYLRGLAVVCSRPMEVAAIVSAINISLTANSDCVEVAELQQKLLWLLYDMGHLRKYPMALGTLGELEEINPTSRINILCDQLYREAIQSARDHYRNHHVYPYTYQGNYFNRLLKYREAFASWANAADVIRLYTYNCRDDDEIYKELLDIANEMIPYVMKTESSGHSARSILRDPEVFANLLRFYDGICQWEEDSLTPILHIGWAKPLVNNITKFDYDIRSQVVIKVPEDIMTAATMLNVEQQQQQQQQHGIHAAHEKTDCNDMKKDWNHAQNSSGNHLSSEHQKKDEKIPLDGSNNSRRPQEIPTTLADLTAACGVKILNPDFLLQGGDQPFAEQKYKYNNNNNINTNNNNNNNTNNNTNNNNNNNNNNNTNNNNNNKKISVNEAGNIENREQSTNDATTNNEVTTTTTRNATATTSSPTTATTTVITTTSTTIATIATTTAAVAATKTTTTIAATSTIATITSTSGTSTSATSTSATSTSATSSIANTTVSTMASSTTTTTTTSNASSAFNDSNNKTSESIVAPAAPTLDEDDPFELMMKRPVITLYSQKMKGLRELLLAEKLNTHAISLQVTAQSVASRKVRGIDKLGNHTTSSLYASVNLAAAAAAAAATTSSATATEAPAADSIALSRPKRMRRE